MPVELTQADVEAITPELEGELTSPQWSAVLDAVKAQVVVAAFPNESAAKIAATYLAAHLATLTLSSSNSGQLQSVEVGGVKKTYAASSTPGVGLRLTTYGSEYERLLSIWCPRWVVV